MTDPIAYHLGQEAARLDMEVGRSLADLDDALRRVRHTYAAGDARNLVATAADLRRHVAERERVQRAMEVIRS